MPTKHPRIAVVNDDELAGALASVRRFFDGTPASRVVHDLAVQGAQALLDEDERRRKSIERLIEWSTGPDMDRDALREREQAWGD